MKNTQVINVYIYEEPKLEVLWAWLAWLGVACWAYSKREMVVE